MSDETKTEGNAATGDKAKAAAGPTDPKDMLKQIWDFVNNPVVANAALGTVLYKVLDPQGIKDALAEVLRNQRKMAEVIDEQSEVILSMKKQISRLRQQLTDEEPEERNEDESLKGYRKTNRKGRVFLD